MPPINSATELSAPTRSELNSLSLDILRDGSLSVIEEEPNMVFIGRGAGRIVALSDQLPEDMVVKFTLPVNPETVPLVRGYVQNAVETHLSQTQNLLSPYITPVNHTPETHYRWITMDYTDVIDGENPDLKSRQNELDQMGINSIDIQMDENWGLYKESPHLNDYGYISPDTNDKLTKLATTIPIWKHHKEIIPKTHPDLAAEWKIDIPTNRQQKKPK